MSASGEQKFGPIRFQKPGRTLGAANRTRTSGRPRLVRRLSARLPPLIFTPTLRLPSICKTGVRTTIRKSPRSCGFALPEVSELTIAGIAPVPTLQTVGIVPCGCWRGGKSDSHKCCGSNDRAHKHSPAKKTKSTAERKVVGKKKVGKKKKAKTSRR